MPVFIRLIIVKMMTEMKNRSNGHEINSPRSRHIINISMMSWYDDAYLLNMLSNIQSSIHVKVTLSLCWKGVFLLLKTTYFVGTFNGSLGRRCDSIFNLYFLFRHEFEVAFAWIVKKLNFSEIAIWGLTSLTIFELCQIFKRKPLLFK